MSNGGVRAKFAAPLTDGAYVPEAPIQHVRDHTKHVRESAVRDLVLEVADDDVAKLLTTATACRRSDATEPDDPQ